MSKSKMLTAQHSTAQHSTAQHSTLDRRLNLGSCQVFFEGGWQKWHC